MDLERIEQSNQQWLVEEFVEVCNQLLPNYLPSNPSNLKIKEEINPRLLRHYTSQKLLDEPLRSGKYAVYTYRHLLQLLVVRSLLSQGIGTVAINDLVATKTNEELKSLLSGGIQLQVTTAHPSLTNSNSALEYLKNLKQSPNKLRNNISKQHFLETNQQNLVNDLSQETNWTRIKILEGLEIHLRSDFAYPKSIKEQENIQQIIIEKFIAIFERKKND